MVMLESYGAPIGHHPNARDNDRDFVSTMSTVGGKFRHIPVMTAALIIAVIDIKTMV